MDSTFTYKCPNCDGPLKFNPKDQLFHCEYCLNTYTEEELDKYDKARKINEATKSSNEEVNNSANHESDNEAHDNTEPTANQNTQEIDGNIDSDSDKSIAEDQGMEVFNCSNCGAQIVTDSTTAATYCYYCHNPVVLTGRVSGKYMPDKILPFKIEKDEAIETFLSLTTKKRFIPKNFFNKKQISLMTGVYFPYWVIKAQIEGQVETIGYQYRIWTVGDIEYTETKEFMAERQGSIVFRDMVKNALEKNTKQGFVEAVQPYELGESIPFKSQYLAGFQAEKRDIEYGQMNDKVKDELGKYSGTIMRETVADYDSLKRYQANMELSAIRTEYTLLPVWLLTYQSNDKSKNVYYYAMNGQTGKVSGDFPIDYKKFLYITLAVFALATLVGLYLGGNIG